MGVRRAKGGISLVEVVITSFMITMVILLIARLFHDNAVIMHKSDLLTKAASLAEDISSKIKDQPFDAVYSFDSRTQHPVKTVYPDLGFNPEAYLIDISSTPMSQVLTDALARVRSQNFDGFRIDVIFVRRDSSGAAGVSTDGYVKWSNYNAQSGTYGPKGGPPNSFICDGVDPNVCFRDLNNDGDYWDVVNGIPETPFTGLKMLTISVFKNNEPIGVKRGTILSLGGFSGNEISSAQSPLKLRISRPISGARAFQVTAATKAALELPTRRTYPSYWFDVTDSRHISQRIDNNSGLSVQLNKTIDVAGNPLSAGYVIPGTDDNLRIYGITDSGQSGTLETTDRYNSAAFPISVDDSAFFTPVGYDFSITGALPTISGPSFLMRDGLHRLWSRKRSNSVPPVYSPYDVRMICADNGIPQKSYFMERYPGPRQRVGITISDYFQADGVTPSYYSGLAFEPTSVIVKNLSTGVSSHTWVNSWQNAGRAIWKNWDVKVVNNPLGAYRTYGATTTLMLRDIEGYPWKLNIGDTYQVTWEWGDRAGYKNTAVETFTPSMGPDTVPNGAYDNSPRPGLINPIRLNYPLYTSVYLNVNYSIDILKFWDTDDGIDYEHIKAEVCSMDIAVAPLNPFAQSDPNCRTIFSKTENIRPDPSVPWGNWIQYGLEFPEEHSLLIYFKFTSPSVGIFSGLNFVSGSQWQIRTWIPNSQGNASVANGFWLFTFP